MTQDNPLTGVRSWTRGRLRWRDCALRTLTQEQTDTLRELIMGLPGVLDCTVNGRVGSLLVLWDEHQTDSAVLMERLLWGKQLLHSQPSHTEPVQASAVGRLPREAARCVLDAVQPLVAPGLTGSPRARRVTQNRLMLGTFGTCLAGLALPGTALHRVSGWLFMGFLTWHLAQHRRVL